MQTVAHRTQRLPAWTHRRITISLVGAVLVAAVAIMLALSLIGSGDQQTAPGVDAPQAAPQEPTQWGGARP